MFSIPEKLQKTMIFGNEKMLQLKKCIYFLKKLKPLVQLVLGHVSAILTDGSYPPGYWGIEGGQAFVDEVLGP